MRIAMSAIANTNGSTYVIKYHWGNDLSGSCGGAAGISGLLYISVTHSSTPNSPTPNSSTHQLYIPWYDNNGNIMGYWDDRGKVVASFTYSAFGETYAYGDNPDAFALRFSTKYHDIESDLYYYTKRFYHPNLHRWLTRDPIEEDGGANLYAMCGNNALIQYDCLGEFSIKYLTERNSTLLEKIRTGNSVQYIEVNNPGGVSIRWRPIIEHGAFVDYPVFVSDCRLEVWL